MRREIELHCCPVRPVDSKLKAGDPMPDRWERRPNGDRVCSCCGSLHPDDYTAILEAYGEELPGYRFNPQSRGFTRFGGRPGIGNDSQGGTRFHLLHVPTAGVARDRYHKANETALFRYGAIASASAADAKR